MEQELADLQGRQRLVERQPLADRGDQLGHRALHAGLVELILDQRLVGWRDIVSEDVFDHLVALVEAVLDQRIARQRADDIEAGHLELVGLRHHGIGRGAVARELDAAGFDELARRQRADAGDDAVALDARLAVRRVEHETAVLDRLGLGIDEGGDAALVDLALDQGRVGRLGVGIVGDAVDDGDVVVGRKRQGVLDAGIAGADDDDLLAVILVGIVELVLHEGMVGALGAGNGELAQIALDADREDDVLGGDGLAVGEAELEIAALALDRGDLGVEADVGLRPLDPRRPALDHLLARALLEAEVAAQRQELGRRHHVLALLVLEDGVVDVGGALEEDVGFPVLGGPCGGAEPCRPRSDNGDRNIYGHWVPTTRLLAQFKGLRAFASLMQYQIAKIDNSHFTKLANPALTLGV